MDKALDPVIEAPLVYPGEAESAKGYAVRAETAADRAEAVVGGLDSLQGLVDAAAGSAAAAAESADDANASKAAASESASAAAESKSAAADSAKAAKDSADGATASASSAGQSAENAARAMQGAGDSATSAKGDAEKSAASAAAAAKSASDAQGYMQTAISAATDANTSAKNAAGSKGAAASSATAAAGSATAAAGDAKTANDAAAVATDAKAAAVAAQKDAADSKAAAASSAIAAKTSKDVAAKSAADANRTANSIKDSMTQIAANKEAIGQLKDGKITKFYASNQGENHLADSDNGKIMDMMVYGKSEQKQYSGKNLLEDGSLKSDNNGKIEYISAGKIKVTASTSTWYSVITNTLKLTPNTNYVLSAKCDSSNGRIICNSVTSTGTDIKCAFLTDSDGLATIAIRCRYESAESRFVYSDLQLEKGSTATDYEPYVGGIPSPNPEYPQEIKSVVKPRVKVCGKNLLNPTLQTTTSNGVTCTNNGDGTYTLNGTATSVANFWLIGSYNNKITLPLNSKKIYVLKGTGHNTIQLHIGTANHVIVSENGDNLVLTNMSGVAFVLLRILNGFTANNLIIYPQLEEGSTTTTYEPYHEQTATLPYTLNAIPVTSGGNVTIDGQQYVADYVDVERGKLVRMCKEVDFEKVESYGILNELTKSCEARYTAGSLGIKALPQITPNNEAGFITSIRRLDPGKATWDLDEVGVWQCGQGTSGNILSIRVSLNLDAVEYFKSIGGCKGIFQAATPTETDLTADEIAAFKSLVSCYPTTNVSTTSDQLDGYTVFNYPISLANGWNYVKQQIGDTRDYLYDIDLVTAEAYVNSAYATAIAEMEV